MMLNHLFMFLLCLPASLAAILDDDPNRIDPCRYTGDTFLDIITLSNNTEAYIDKNDNATAACYKEFEETYPQALEEFIKQMTEASCKVGTYYNDVQNILQSYAFLATLEFKNLGIEMKKLYLSIKKVFERGNYKAVKQYEKEVKSLVYPKYQTYISYLESFKANHNNGKTEEINEIIGTYCKTGTFKLMRVAIKFKTCMDGRINMTEEYLKSEEEKKLKKYNQKIIKKL